MEILSQVAQNWKFVVAMPITLFAVIIGGVYFSIAIKHFRQASKEYEKKGDLGSSYRAQAELYCIVALSNFLMAIVITLMVIALGR